MCRQSEKSMDRRAEESIREDFEAALGKPLLPGFTELICWDLLGQIRRVLTLEDYKRLLERYTPEELRNMAADYLQER
jgi:hypothetical protein